MDLEAFRDIATQMMAADTIELNGETIPVRRTSSHRLRTVSFAIDGHQFSAIEQNPDKPSRWGQLARAGHQVVQFVDEETRRFIAVSIDGKLKEYSR